MMRYSKLAIMIIVAVMLILSMSAALAETTLSGLWKSGCDLLFHTENVTVTGEATFTLNEVKFKTALLDYTQDGRSSFYGLKLLTPRKDGTERETGWTIIADGEGDIFVMEAYYPGTYRNGTGYANNTLLRHSIQLDALTELGGSLAKQLEAMLPEDAFTVEGKTAHIKLNGDQIPPMAVSALNVAAGYLSDRWFSYSHDRNVEEYEVAFDDYITVTQALTDGTVRWTLHDLDATVTVDDEGRLTAVQGSACVSSTFLDGTVREVTVGFDLTMTDYGTSHVKPFDPAEYNVVLQREMFEEEDLQQ